MKCYSSRSFFDNRLSCLLAAKSLLEKPRPAAKMDQTAQPRMRVTKERQWLPVSPTCPIGSGIPASHPLPGGSGTWRSKALRSPQSAPSVTCYGRGRPALGAARATAAGLVAAGVLGIRSSGWPFGASSTTNRYFAIFRCL